MIRMNVKRGLNRLAVVTGLLIGLSVMRAEWRRWAFHTWDAYEFVGALFGTVFIALLVWLASWLAMFVGFWVADGFRSSRQDHTSGKGERP